MASAGINAGLAHPVPIPNASAPKPLGNYTLRHLSEKILTASLDAMGIPWEYEPVVFTTRSRLKDGQEIIEERFSPDFYIPDIDLYIELTSMKPGLRTDKNGKIKRATEIYGKDIVLVECREDPVINGEIKIRLFDGVGGENGIGPGNNGIHFYTFQGLMQYLFSTRREKSQQSGVPEKKTYVM
jgi:hypothetical protein